jgi:hypothetical protein
MAGSEFTPELFLCPEVFMNCNHITLPDSRDFEMEFPEWCQSAFAFIEYHRDVLESLETKVNINQWIDLLFGYKQTGKKAAKAMNLFNPIGYESASLPADTLAIRDEWRKTCGQIPRQIFSERSPPFKPLPKPDDVAFRLEKFEDLSFLEVHSADVLDHRVSPHETFVVFTLIISQVTVYRTKPRCF